MFAPERILGLDVGASKLLLAEFSTRGAEPVLLRYAFEELPSDITGADASATQSLAVALRTMMQKHGFKPAPLLMTLPGQRVFPRYVKLPPVAPDKISEMVEIEAEQNVPFPISEVVWDFQTIESEDDVELNVLLVAAKKEDIKELTDGVIQTGLVPQIVDTAPMALYNAVRFNYPDEEGCTVVLDLGARSTNLVFIEGSKIFTRSIPVAGNTITQEIAKTLAIDQAEAEALKRETGFVALGGVYSVTDDDRAERVSKVIRNVVTRLHAEVNRSINFYRSQQEGTPPKKVLLTGGTALIPHMDTFFREKLQVEVEYFNPFVNMAIDSRLEAARTEESDAELMRLGCVVGLALRRSMRCPVEINLLPPELAARRLFMRRVPYFILSAVGLVLAMVCWSLYANQLGKGYREQYEVVQERLERLEKLQREVASLQGEQSGIMEKADLLGRMAINRNVHSHILERIRRDLLDGMWLTRLEPFESEGSGGTKLVLEGIAYEDSLQKTNPEGDAARAVDKFLTALTEGAESPFVAEESRVVRTLLQPPGRIFRQFELELKLRHSLGDPTAGGYSISGEGQR